MNIKLIRCYVSSYYGEQWKRKVASMPDRQVIAIYYSLLNRERKVKEQERQNRGNVQQNCTDEPEYKQMTIFDYMEV